MAHGDLMALTRQQHARGTEAMLWRAYLHRFPLSRLHTGVITVVHRSRSDLGLYVHLHYLVADCVFEEAVGDEADAEGERQAPVFLALPESTDEDLVAVLRAVASDRRLAEHIDLGEQDVDPGISLLVFSSALRRLARRPPRLVTPAGGLWPSVTSRWMRRC